MHSRKPAKPFLASVESNSAVGGTVEASPALSETGSQGGTAALVAPGSLTCYRCRWIFFSHLLHPVPDPRQPPTHHLPLPLRLNHQRRALYWSATATETGRPEWWRDGGRLPAPPAAAVTLLEKAWGRGGGEGGGCATPCRFFSPTTTPPPTGTATMTANPDDHQRLTRYRPSP